MTISDVATARARLAEWLRANPIGKAGEQDAGWNVRPTPNGAYPYPAIVASPGRAADPQDLQPLSKLSASKLATALGDSSLDDGEVTRGELARLINATPSGADIVPPPEWGGEDLPSGPYPNAETHRIDGDAIKSASPKTEAEIEAEFNGGPPPGAIVPAKATVTISGSFAAAHRIARYGKCAVPHGHNFHVEFQLEGVPDANGVVIDFSLAKGVFRDWLNANVDHRLIVDRDDAVGAAIVDGIERAFIAGGEGVPQSIAYVMQGPPSCENLAAHFFDVVWPQLADTIEASALAPETMPLLAAVSVWETDQNVATYEG